MIQDAKGPTVRIHKKRESLEWGTQNPNSWMRHLPIAVAVLGERYVAGFDEVVFEVVEVADAGLPRGIAVVVVGVGGGAVVGVVEQQARRRVCRQARRDRSRRSPPFRPGLNLSDFRKRAKGEIPD